MEQPPNMGQPIGTPSLTGGMAAPTQDERTWGMLAHVSALVVMLVTAGTLAPIGPLVVMLTKGKESAWVNAQAKEALNFQITLLLAAAAVTLLLLVTCIGAALLPVVLPALALAGIVLSILAGLKANDGQLYRYPLTWRLVK